MDPHTVRRINKELQSESDNPTQGVTLSFGPDKEDPSVLSGTIDGVPGSLYEGMTFRLKIGVPEDYPFSPCKYTFLDDTFHPNIHENGEFCVGINKKEWCAALTIAKNLLIIQAMMDEPDLVYPVRVDVADLYQFERDDYNRQVKKVLENTKKKGSRSTLF